MRHTKLNRLFLFLALMSAMLLSYPGNQQTQSTSLLPRYLAADKLYNQALQLSAMENADERVQEKADQLFQQALREFLSLSRTPKQLNDSLSFFIHSKTAYIHYLFDSSHAALENYRVAIQLKHRSPAVRDSFLFTPLVYSAAIYYSRSQFDSALQFFKQAEELNDRYGGRLNESQRLFNRLGVLYFENGNYQLARNYFEKAIAVAPVSALSLRANYELNIASLHVKLDELDQAKQIYESMLAREFFTNESWHNLGIISLRKKEYAKAAELLGKVHYGDKKNIDLYYNQGMAYSGLGKTDSAGQYLYKAIAENLKWNGHRKNVAYGLILKFQADEMAEKQQYKAALPIYQQAIMQFAPDFEETDPAKNPENFSSVFSYINLFNALIAKAAAMEESYPGEKDMNRLIAALDTYRAAFKLAAHVEAMYNSDEARLFLGKIKHTAHSRPIDLSLRLYELTKKKNYLEDAYFFDQRNKASVLTLNIRMQGLQLRDSSTASLYRQEENLRTAITRLALKAAAQTDSQQLAQLKTAILDKEIELNNVREEINKDPSRKELLLAEHIPAISQLQQKLDNRTTLLSFHLGSDKMLGLLISENRFAYYQVPLSEQFFTAIATLKKNLYQAIPGQRYQGGSAATWLYQQLFKPILSSLGQTKRLIIIPDDELHYLPFEVLQDEQDNYLLQKFAIQYQYSTALLGNENSDRSSREVLAFAPFTNTGYQDPDFTLSRLPASGEEIKDVNGLMLLDSLATKDNFLLKADHYPIIHLATHAIVNDNDPQHSFISFYPGSPGSRLYGQEVYDLRLNTAKLIILSACETGTGQLIKGEGLMSLSRAFAYAGCPNIVTSLWKAEDKAVAFITRRLHYYLQRKETTDQALRQAKLDLLESPDIDPRLKSPEHWANLVFIGEFEPDHRRSDWIWVAIGIVSILLAYYFIKKRAIKRNG